MVKKFHAMYNKSCAAASAVWTIICGMIIHLFRLVTPIHNYDDIYSQPIGYGSGASSGRWFLNFIGDFIEKWFGGYNIPVINGLIFIFFISISAGFLVSSLEIKNRKIAILIGVILISFPTATSTLLFTFTAPYYGFGIALSVIAAWILPKHKFLGIIASAVCTALSLGIYQAYMPITVALFVLILIRKALEDDITPKKFLMLGISECCALILGVAIYFVCTKAAISHYETVLDSYQGIRQMGQISIGELPKLLWQSFKSFCRFPIDNYGRLAQTNLLKISYISLGVFTIAMIAYIIAMKKDKLIVIGMTLPLLLVFPIAVNFIVIMCPDSWIYTLMVYAFAIIPCTPLVIWEVIPKKTGKLKYVKSIAARVIAAFVIIIVLCNSYIANTNYIHLYYTNRQVENYLNGIIIQVRMTDDFDAEKKWALVGDINDPLLNGLWQDTPYYGGNTSTIKLLNAYSRQRYISTYIGYSVPLAEDDEIDKLRSTDQFKNMPCWPAEGSIEVIGDYVVVKFDEE